MPAWTMEGRWLKKRRAEEETLGLKRLAGLSSPLPRVHVQFDAERQAGCEKRCRVRERHRDGGTLAEEALGD